MILLYDLALVLVFLAALPKLGFDYFFRKKYHSSIAQRFGLKGFPKRNSEEEYIIWMHAISVGETKAAAALLREILADTKNVRVVVSSVTETGHAEAKRIMKGASDFFYLPLDFSWSIEKVVKAIRPNLTVLVEGEFWYNWLYYLKKEKSNIVLVNGKISARSAKRFAWASFFAKKLFSLIDFFCLQNQEHEARFTSLGVPEYKMMVTGNLKFDFVPKRLSPSEKETLKDALGITASNQVLVIGSTHEGEEELLLRKLSDVFKSIPNLKILVVPRHPERFASVGELIKQKYPLSSIYSEKTRNRFEAQVVLVDKMGILCDCYQIADVAIVAGSFATHVGGHNILEPLIFGVPTLFGPSMYSQEELKKLVLEYKAGLQVEADELDAKVIALLQDRRLYDNLHQNSQKLLQSYIGTAHKTYVKLASFYI